MYYQSISIYSISNTAKFGGEVGWVNKSRMSDNISVKLENIKIGGVTDLIKVPNGFLIIKVLDKKMETIEQNEEEDLKQLIIYERDRQLNEFSSIYFQKIKKSSLINEK